MSCAKLIQRIHEVNIGADTSNEGKLMTDGDGARMCCKYLHTVEEGGIDRLGFYDLRIAFIISAHSIKLQVSLLFYW